MGGIPTILQKKFRCCASEQVRAPCLHAPIPGLGRQRKSNDSLHARNLADIEAHFMYLDLREQGHQVKHKFRNVGC